jgi:hypothetical protein
MDFLHPGFVWNGFLIVSMPVAFVFHYSSPFVVIVSHFPHYPITMKMQYLRQFPMVSHHPGLDLNAFSTVLNAMPSAFAIVFAFVFVAAVTVAMIRFFPQSYLRHFPIVQPHCGVI